MSEGLDKQPLRLATATAELSLTDHQAAEYLKHLDRFATDNVRAGTGGPFAAELFIHNCTNGDLISLSGPRGNAVLAKGIASAHAEAETLTHDAAEAALGLQRQHMGNDLRLIQISSAESCPACRAKQIAFLHRLKSAGWPMDARIDVVFAASYEDTQRIAGFNDKPYHDDLMGQLDPPMIARRHLTYADLPVSLRDALAQRSRGAFAAIMLPDPLNTAVCCIELITEPVADLTFEVAALQAASGVRVRAGVARPWYLSADGVAVLITTAAEIGPLMLTDSQWAGITEIWQVTDHPATPSESPLMGNGDLLARVRLAYNAPGADLAVRHLPVGSHGLDNRAQQVWRDEVISQNPERLYNGSDHNN